MKKLLLPLIAGFLPASLSAQLIINEFLADPPNDLAGDANGDGTRDSSTDEFIELVNTSGASVDIENWTISDGFGLRHAFVGSTVVADGQSLVIFGGGTPTGTFGGAVVTTASSGSLGLNNGGDTITIFDENNAFVSTYTYGGEGGNNTSLTLDPDLTGGAFIDHVSIGDGSLAFSPGTKNDGNPFAGDSLSLTIDPANFSEGAGAGAASGTVTRSGDLSASLTVTLASSDTSEVTVPATVDILAGQASATFSVDAVDDPDQDAGQSATITASADGIFSGTFGVMIEDDEDPIPTITLSADPARISENGETSTVTIEISAASDTGYTFDLSGDDTTELMVPSTVTVPALATTATFVVTGIDDADTDGAQTVTVTASDPGALIVAAEVEVIVTDDEAFTAPAVVINELRTDNAGTDTEEYLEIYSATTDFSLDRVWLIVLGDRGGSDTTGNIDRAYELTGMNATGNYFLIGNDNMTGATPDFFVGTNIFENGDSETFLLVTDFTGAVGDDLDTDNDGSLDSEPWGSVIDAVSIVEPGDAPGSVGFGYAESLGFAGANVTSDGEFVPAHVFRSPNGTGAWFLGAFGSEEVPATDTPKTENGVPVGPPVGEVVVVVDFFLDQGGASAVIVAKGLGVKSWKIQTSDDLGNADAWADLSVGFVETDNPDGTTSFTFAREAGDERQFYRLIEQ